MSDTPIDTTDTPVEAGNVTNIADAKKKRERKRPSYGPDEWQSGLKYNVDSGTLKSKSIENARLYLTEHPDVAGALSYNELTMHATIERPFPWDRASKECPRQLADNDATAMCAWLERQGQFGFNTSGLYPVILYVAGMRSYNPLQDYLTGLQWDGEERLYRWLPDYLGAANTPYTRAIGFRFMVSAVARAMQPGCKVDTMLILEGEQGRRKSTALATLFGREFFTDDLHAIGSKDAGMQLQGNWCVEMAELTQMDRAEERQMKEWLSRQVDKFRPPYGRAVVPSPRSCVVVGTCNVLDREYLKDATGARRFWPVEVERCLIEDLAAARDQLWAEAMHCYQNGEQWWLTEAEIALALPEQDARREVDSWEDSIRNHISGTNQITAESILSDALKIEIGKQNQIMKRRVGKCLKALGWKSCKAKVGGAAINVWRPDRRGIDLEVAGFQFDHS